MLHLICDLFFICLYTTTRCLQLHCTREKPNVSDNRKQQKLENCISIADSFGLPLLFDAVKEIKNIFFLVSAPKSRMSHWNGFEFLRRAESERVCDKLTCLRWNFNSLGWLTSAFVLTSFLKQATRSDKF